MSSILATAPVNPILLLSRALSIASKEHALQRRGDGLTAYINHPIEVFNILVENGVDDVHVLCAALMHDVLEDTVRDAEVVAGIIGCQVSPEALELVRQVTVKDKLTFKQRLEQLHARAIQLSPRAELIRYADSLSNLRTLCLNPPLWSKGLRDDYAKLLRATHESFSQGKVYPQMVGDFEHYLHYYEAM